MQLQSNVNFSDSSSSPDNTVNAAKLTDLVNTASFATGIEIADLEQSLKTALGLNSNNVLEVEQSDLSSALQTALGLTGSSGSGSTDGTITEASLSTSLLALLRIVKDTTTTPDTYTPENTKIVNVDPTSYNITVNHQQTGTLTLPAGTKGFWYYCRFNSPHMSSGHRHVATASSGGSTINLFELEVDAEPDYGLSFNPYRPYTWCASGYAPISGTSITIELDIESHFAGNAIHPDLINGNIYVEVRALNT